MVDRRNMLIGTGAAALFGAGAVWSGARSMGSMAEYAAAIAALRAPLPPSPEAADLTRSTPVADPDNHHLFVSLGCAAENLAVAAASRGMPGEVRFDLAAAGISFVHISGAAIDTALSDAIPLRQSTRSLYDGTILTPVELASLASAARMPGVDLLLITDPAQIGKLTDLIATANTAQIADPAFMTELKHWMRFNPRRAMSTGDGLFSAVSGNPAMPDWLGPLVLGCAYPADNENKKTAAKIASSAGLAVFVGANDDPGHWVRTGRACQRFALQATAMGLEQAFLNQPVEVAALRPDPAALIGMPGRRPDLVMRFGRGARCHIRCAGRWRGRWHDRLVHNSGLSGGAQHLLCRELADSNRRLRPMAAGPCKAE